MGILRISLACLLLFVGGCITTGNKAYLDEPGWFPIAGRIESIRISPKDIIAGAYWTDTEWRDRKLFMKKLKFINEYWKEKNKRKAGCPAGEECG